MYRIEGDDSGTEATSRLSAYVSYGGLLMRLQGDANNLHGIVVDQNLYLLLKKLAFWCVYQMNKSLPFKSKRSLKRLFFSFAVVSFKTDFQKLLKWKIIES